MSNGDPGSFLTSAVTSGAARIGISAGAGALTEGFQGAWLGASIGSIVGGPGGAAIGAGVGAALGAAFGSLTATSKALNRVWGNLIRNTRKLLDTYSKFDPILLAQQERWKRLDVQIGKAWANAIAPTMKHLTDIGTELTARWTKLKISVFKSWEGSINTLITALGVLAHGAANLAEFLEKIKNMLMDMIRTVIGPIISGFTALAKLLGLIAPTSLKDSDGPSWESGISPGYSDKSASGLGGTPLLRGKFKPGMDIPEWAQEGKLEFGWFKDLKSWLGGHLDRIANLLAGGPVGDAMVKLTDPELYKEAKKARELNKKYPFDQPISEEELEEARQKLKKQKGENKAGALLGAAGAVSRAVGLSAFTSIPSEPKVLTEEHLGYSDKSAAGSGSIPLSRGKFDPDKNMTEPTPQETWDMHNQERTGKSSQHKPTEKELAQWSRTKYHKREVKWAKEAQAKEDETEETEITETESQPDQPSRSRSDSAGGNVIMQVLDSNQLLEMLSFSWDEVRNVLRQQRAEYTLLKYRMQTEGTYL